MDAAAVTQRRGGRKLFYLVTVLVPVLFFIMLELCLRLFNYGINYHQWVESPNGQWISAHGRYLMLNPEIARRYFPTLKHIPVSNEDAFEKVKSANAFRVFVLGGSSGAGFPFEPDGAFSRYLEDRLSLAYPGSRIEVVNCSMTAVNSYTLLDLTPGILKEKPDLILIYAGHNEYYGALGAGSLESFGDSRALVNFTISLERYRTYQLMRNLIDGIGGIFAGRSRIPTGTMMAQMARDRYIPYKSSVYERGLSQFRGNMGDILKMIRKAGVPVIIGTLTCNLRDQPPFVSDSSSGYPPAAEVYGEAQSDLSEKKLRDADSLFRYARDLDELRFRAPGEMNVIIRGLGRKYDVPVLNIDSAFDAASPDHITGDNLIVDHLHPNMRGYRLMGELFYDKMEQLHYLPRSTPSRLPGRTQDSLTAAEFRLSTLDSVIGAYKMAVLKNDWPFVKNAGELSYSKVIRPENPVDSLAAQFVEQKISWKNAHLYAAQWYIDNDDVSGFLREMDALIDQYPYATMYYELAAKHLIMTGEYALAEKYLSGAYDIEPDAYSAKWLGLISLRNDEADSAGLYLNQSLGFYIGDPQVWFGLAELSLKKDKRNSLRFLNEALALDPKYKQALDLRNELLSKAK